MMPSLPVLQQADIPVWVIAFGVFMAIGVIILVWGAYQRAKQSALHDASSPKHHEDEADGDTAEPPQR